MNLNIIKNIPIPISGLILALLSLGNLLQGYSLFFKIIFGLIGVIFIVLLLYKFYTFTDDFIGELSNPIILMNSGTFSMSLMILSTYINSFFPDLALFIWILGVGLHILLIIYFTYNHIIHNFNILFVYPSYWIVFVGISMGAITAHVHGLSQIAFIFFIFGFSSMLITLPLVIYRYLKYPNKLNQNKPLVCIFTALISILIVAYINSVGVVSYWFLMILYTFSFAFYLFALYKFVDYRNLEFYPSFSAFTFPFVISAIASAEVFKINQSIFLSNIALIETLIAVILVIYVLYRYLKFLSKIK